MANTETASPIWFGKVVDRVDPLDAGRLKVRIVGVHSDEVEDDVLPWALVNQPINSAALGGVGVSPTGILTGSQVWGHFLDGPGQQIPLVVGTIGGITNDILDISELATGVNKLDKGTQGLEPASQYAAQYPFNKTTTTESGHVIEYDDTPGAERLHFYHRTGSYSEFNPDGSYVHRTVEDDFDIIVKDKTVFVGGNLKIVTEGNADIQVVGDVSVQSEGSSTIVSGTSITLKAPDIILQETDTELDLAVAQSQSHVRENGAIVLFDDEIPEGGSVNSTLLEEFPSPSVSDTPTERGVQTTTGRATTRVSCLDLNIQGRTVPRGSPIYNTRLSRNYTLGQLSVNTVLSRNPIRAQVGLDPGDIICNLKAVAENILEPMRARYPGFNINSGFRADTGASQHNKGQAVDLQWPNKTNRQMFEIAQWAARNLPVDQLIVEHGRRIWLHISYNRTASRQRGKLTTMINNRYTSGLSLHY